MTVRQEMTAPAPSAHHDRSAERSQLGYEDSHILRGAGSTEIREEAAVAGTFVARPSSRVEKLRARDGRRADTVG